MKQQSHCEETGQIDGVVPGDSEPTRDPAPQFALPSVMVGRLASFVSGSAPLVDFPTNESGDLVAARSIVALNEVQVGSEVALVFEDGDSSRPIILGVVQNWDAQAAAPMPAQVSTAVEVQRDVDSLLLTAAREITLRCGKASITLTSAGKLLLRGAYLLSRSSGVNRIKGGSVQIN